MGYTICMLEDISIEFYAALFINKAVYHLQSPGLYHIQRGSSRPPIDPYTTNSVKMKLKKKNENRKTIGNRSPVFSHHRTCTQF